MSARADGEPRFNHGRAGRMLPGHPGSGTSGPAGLPTQPTPAIAHSLAGPPASSGFF